jgi:hypothetical protein
VIGTAKRAGGHDAFTIDPRSEPAAKIDQLYDLIGKNL